MVANGVTVPNKDPYLRFLASFTNSLSHQLDSFAAGSALHRTPPAHFHERVASALQQASKAVQRFEEEVRNAACDTGHWDIHEAWSPAIGQPLYGGYSSNRSSLLQEADVNADIPKEREGEASPDFSRLVQKHVEHIVDIKRLAQLNGDGHHDQESIEEYALGESGSQSGVLVSHMASSGRWDRQLSTPSPKVQFSIKDAWEDEQRASVHSTSEGLDDSKQMPDARNSVASSISATIGDSQPNCIELDEEDDEDNNANSKCVQGVLNPNWHGRLAWDLNTMMLVLIDAMVLPFQMAYKEGSAPDAFDTFWLYATTSFFAVDIVLNFNTAYAAGKKDTEFEPGRLVTNRSLIARNYSKTWLPIDVVSTVPWGKLSTVLIGGDDSGGAGQLGKLTKVIKFVRFMRLMRMLRLAKLATIWERIEAKSGSIVLLQGVGLLRVLFVLVCICHWNACIWWMVGQPKSLFTELLSDEAARDWEERTVHWTQITRSHGPGMDNWTWLDRSQNEAYIFCFYWTLGVMRTMPAEVQPVNQVERLYIMVFMFFAFSAFAICVAQITQTFFKFSERRRQFNDDMAQVRLYLRGIKVSEQVQQKVKMYLKHMYDTRKIIAKETAMISHVPPMVKKQLNHAKLVIQLEKLEILKSVSNKALQAITDFVFGQKGQEVPCCELQDISPGEVLSVKGRTPDSCIVVAVGRLHVVKSQEQRRDEGKERVKTVEIVDEECLQDPKYKSRFTVAAMLASSVLHVYREAFWQLRTDFPHLLEKERRSRRTGRLSQNSVISGDFNMDRVRSSTQSTKSTVTASTSVRPSHTIGLVGGYGNKRNADDQEEAAVTAAVMS